ncbi:MAG TPA: hypothetical protein VFT16_00085 [Candidatus Saccharimonadales bacterium]|nr:hypothetical protein [Candidatus Saccharimonadales bacterium]
MIVAGMATMPDRLPYLEEVVETMRPQVDALRVYLNNFVEVPGFLRPEEAILSSDARGDLGAEGKLYWMDGKDGLEDYTHYLTIDDDLGYPDDYVSTLAKEFDARGGKAIVGVHGSTFLHPVENFVESRDERFRFYEALNRARQVHLLGTATTMWSRDTIELDLDKDFPIRNASDLQLAVAAQKQQVPMIAIARPEQWVTEKRPWTNAGFSIWKSTKAEGHSQVKTQLAKTAVARWVLYPDPIN